MTPSASFARTSPATSKLPVQCNRLGQRKTPPAARSTGIAPRTRSARSALLYTSTSHRTLSKVPAFTPSCMVKLLCLFTAFATPAAMARAMARDGIRLRASDLRRHFAPRPFTVPVAACWRRQPDGTVHLAVFHPYAAAALLKAKPGVCGQTLLG